MMDKLLFAGNRPAFRLRKGKPDRSLFPCRLAALILALLLGLTPVSGRAATALSKGSRGSEVQRLQQRLDALGYAPGKADGSFGSATWRAVMLFQSRNGLTMDGVAGEKTLNALYADSARGAVQDHPEAKPYETENGLPLLVNLDHPLEDGYIYYDLVFMNDYCDRSIVKMKYDNTWAEREAVDALMVMLQDAVSDGYKNWQISAAGRTVSDQKRLLNSRINSNVKNGMSKKRAESAARQTVAEPGSSEHHLGVCFDITIPGASFGSTKQYQWISEHCWEYGFILRYPADKTDITGFAAEVWHYRYVGTEASLYMREHGLCLEEYMEIMNSGS